MSVVGRYLSAGALASGTVLLLFWPFLDPASRRGMAVAFAVALPAQGVFFGLLARVRDRPQEFLRAWVVGMLGRLVLLGGFGLFVALRPVFPPLPTLLSFAGLLFGLLLLEPVFLGKAGRVHGRGR